MLVPTIVVGSCEIMTFIGIDVVGKGQLEASERQGRQQQPGQGEVEGLDQLLNSLTVVYIQSIVSVCFRFQLQHVAERLQCAKVDNDGGRSQARGKWKISTEK